MKPGQKKVLCFTSIQLFQLSSSSNSYFQKQETITITCTFKILMDFTSFFTNLNLDTFPNITSNFMIIEFF